MELNIAEVSDSWEELVSTGIVLVQDMDQGRWALGDLVSQKVVAKYGEDSIGKYAAEIGVAKAQTLRDYARVARRYQIAFRNAFSDSSLTFTHFRAAMRAGEDAEMWLARAADENWPVAEMARQIAEAIGKPVPPAKLWEGRAIVAANWPGGGVMLIPQGTPCDLPDGQIVTVKVYEATGAA
jgi:hypothetical protein